MTDSFFYVWKFTKKMFSLNTLILNTLSFTHFSHKIFKLTLKLKVWSDAEVIRQSGFYFSKAHREDVSHPKSGIKLGITNVMTLSQFYFLNSNKNKVKIKNCIWIFPGAERSNSFYRTKRDIFLLERLLTIRWDMFISCQII